jgi:hypothetical protein
VLGQQAPKPLATIHFASDELVRLNGLDRTVRVVLRSPAEWAAFWNAQGLPTYAEVPPELDFTTEMVLLAAADVAPDSLVGTQIDSVWIERDTIVAAVKLYSGAGCSIPTVLVPVSAVRAPRMDHPVPFVDRLAKGGC